MNINFYFFGKKTEITKDEEEFLRRINFSHTAQIIPLQPSGQKNETEARKIEEQTFENRKRKGKLFLLDEKGKTYSSTAFADLVKQEADIDFLIGGAFGVSEKIKASANKTISLSPMTWTKDLARIMLLEQTYRATEIIKGSKFHKDG